MRLFSNVAVRRAQVEPVVSNFKKKIPKALFTTGTIGVSEYWLGEQWHGGPTIFSVVDFVEY